MINCASCGAENPAGHSFCSNCGSAFARVCPNCETANDGGNRFCFNCGTALADAEPTAPMGPVDTPDPISDPGERRLVSVLFADLVGFTTFSEGRDPEDVRGMLTRFYERCREIISRYGGTTDKFIGDAVMGVWGAKGAHEDDAERATRAGLELVDMVEGLGSELGVPDLAARAGVLSGEASVGSGGNEQGLVVGDLVNTASRLQSIAEPGTVYVGAATRDLVGASIEFREVGDHQVKGKDVPVRAFEAIRVLALSTAKAGGELLEGPFVGRDDELRLLKDQLHATGREQRARMVSVIGEGGIGKSRLAQELIRYIDGIAEVVYYHRGRSPSYGDGVTYWALGEMIKQRAGISETEDPPKARLKLRTMVADFCPSEEDQRWIEPRLAALIGLGAMPSGDRSELFAALRALFQAVSARGTVLMVFEDLHWADEGLLDFVEELVERTTAHPVLVLCLTRPELLERRPDWAASRKRTLAMHLSRLDESSMRSLVSGLAPGIPENLVGRISERTAGVPLHAVEFVRMLLNTGELVFDGDTFAFAGTDEDLAIPDTVSAIIGARLDRLSPNDLSIIQDASVLGLSFTLSSLSQLRQVEPHELEARLRDLVRKEILELDEDPRSPERGQYQFVQGLIREVTYGRLSRPERVKRHLEVARLFESLDEPELAGVVANHYADAVDADPTNAELVQMACRSVVAAAERAVALRSDLQAAGLYERAANMTIDDHREVELRLLAARCLINTSREDRGADLAQLVLDWSRTHGDSTLEVRASTTLSLARIASFEADRAVSAVLPLYESLPPSNDVDWVHLAAETARALMLTDRAEEAVAVADTAIPIMEGLELVEELIETINTKATALGLMGRFMEGSTLLRGVAEVAGRRGLLKAQARALNNLVASTQNDDQTDTETLELLSAIVEKIGDSGWTVRSAFFAATGYLDLGQLDRAAETLASVRDEDISEFWLDNLEQVRLSLEQAREGFHEDRHRQLLDLNDKYLSTDDPQLRAGLVSGKAQLLFDAGDYAEALAVTRGSGDEGNSYPNVTEQAILAAALVSDAVALGEALEYVEENFSRGRACRGLALVARSYLAALNGNTDDAVRFFISGDEIWSHVMMPLTLAKARAVFARAVGAESPFAAEKAAQARAFFEDNGFRIHLEGIMQSLSEPIDPSELAV